MPPLAASCECAFGFWGSAGNAASLSVPRGTLAA